MGRPTKRTADVEAAVIAALEKGHTKRAAAAAGGIGYSTMREWELAYPEFAERTQKAEAEGTRFLFGIIVEAAATSWQAAAWALERRHPEEYSRRERVDINLDMRTVIDRLTDDPTEREAAVAEAQRILSERR